MAAIFKMADGENLKKINIILEPLNLVSTFIDYHSGFSIQRGYVRGYIVTCLQSQP